MRTIGSVPDSDALSAALVRAETLEHAADQEEASAKRARRRANAGRHNYERLLAQHNGQDQLHFGAREDGA